MVKKQSRRSRDPYPGLKPELNLRNRQELIDHDYVDKLTHEEKQWLSNFNEEYISGNFKHKGEKLHKTAEERRSCYNRNNARNRDVFANCRTKGWLTELQVDEVNLKDLIKTENLEETMVELLDLEYERQKSELIKPEDEGSNN